MTFQSSPSLKKQKTMAKYDDNDPKTGALEAPFLKLFSTKTTNGRKITLFLELLGIDYVYRETEYLKETKEPWFLKINPNGKIPVIEDVDKDGKAFALAESGAILEYLAANYDKEHKYSHAPGTEKYWEEREFLFFHASGVSVAQAKYNQAKGSGADAATLDSLKQQVLNSYGLVDKQLKANGSGYLVGDHFSIADAIALPHAIQLKDVSDIDTSSLPNLEKWIDTLKELPAIKAAYEK